MFLLIVSCESDILKEPSTTNISQENNIDMIIVGELTSYSQCKSFNKNTNQLASNESCIEYSFDDTNSTLHITHINAGFNCCPVEITTTINHSNDTIYIVENEGNPLCNCSCLYDLEIDIKNIKEGKYIMNIIEPYAPTDSELCFEINLTETNNGDFCVTRDLYPWDSF